MGTSSMEKLKNALSTFWCESDDDFETMAYGQTSVGILSPMALVMRLGYVRVLQPPT
jgi:hypothetical protein